MRPQKAKLQGKTCRYRSLSFSLVAIAIVLTGCADGGDPGDDAQLPGGDGSVSSVDQDNDANDGAQLPEDGDAEPMVDQEDGAENDTQLPGDEEFAPVVDPNEEIPDPSPDSISDTLLLRSENSVLLMLIENANLAEELGGDNDGDGWTLFAFSDVAYDNENIQTVTDEQSASLVRGHLYEGRLRYEDMRPGLLQMLEGSVEVMQNDDGTLSVGGASVVARDREFSNGIIHFVDSVLDPFQ